MSPRPLIVCAQCGAPGGQGLMCAKCNGALVKICPNCEFKNSTVKNYCDACGTEIRETQEGSGSTRPATPPNTVTRKPGQIVQNPGPQAPAAGTSLPQAGRSQQSFEPPKTAPPPIVPPAAVPPPAAPPPAAPPTPSGLPTTLGVPPPAAQPAPTTQPAAPRPAGPRAKPAVSRPFLPSGLGYFAKSVAAIVAMLAMAGAAGTILLMVRHAGSADVVVPKLARRYLNALKDGDYATAYGMLTDNARAAFTVDDFRMLRDTTAWTWSDLQIAKIEPDAVVMKYDLSIDGRPPIKDTLVFVNDNGRWARPYNWPVLLSAEQAFEQNDPDMALIKAGEAVRLDPRDPMARGYLCESVFYRQLADRVEQECNTALELADRYPSKLSPKTLYHLHALLAEHYRTTPGSEMKAVGEYTTMLKFPDMSAQDQCELLHARAAMYQKLGQSAEAGADEKAAADACSEQDQ